eukprot:5195071-Pyramimonas_sp.AAC.1
MQLDGNLRSTPKAAICRMRALCRNLSQSRPSSLFALEGHVAAAAKRVGAQSDATRSHAKPWDAP